MPSCELCGRNMQGHGRNVTIEGALLQVCPQCADKFVKKTETGQKKTSSFPKHDPSWTRSPELSISKPSSRPQSTPKIRKKNIPRRTGPHLDEMDIIEDYAKVIRTARQKKNLSQEELAQKVGERVSTLQSIESARLKPTRKTIRGLERELEISLLESIGTPPIKSSYPKSSIGPTLGDRVVVKRKKSQKGK